MTRADTEAGSTGNFPSSSTSNEPQSASPLVQPAQALGWAGLATAIAAIAMLVSEIVTVAASAVWATASLLHLGTISSAILAVIIGIPSLWACAFAVRTTIAAEREFGN